jgi:hypothetical protein
MSQNEIILSLETPTLMIGLWAGRVKFGCFLLARRFICFSNEIVHFAASHAETRLGVTGLKND